MLTNGKERRRTHARHTAQKAEGRPPLVIYFEGQWQHVPENMINITEWYLLKTKDNTFCHGLTLRKRTMYFFPKWNDCRDWKHLRYRGTNLKDAPIMWRRINSIGIILDCNSTYAANLGYAKSEILGKPIFEHVPKESWESMNESLKIWFNEKCSDNISLRAPYLLRCSLRESSYALVLYLE